MRLVVQEAGSMVEDGFEQLPVPSPIDRSRHDDSRQESSELNEQTRSVPGRAVTY